MKTVIWNEAHTLCMVVVVQPDGSFDVRLFTPKAQHKLLIGHSSSPNWESMFTAEAVSNET